MVHTTNQQQYHTIVFAHGLGDSVSHHDHDTQSPILNHLSAHKYNAADLKVSHVSFKGKSRLGKMNPRNILGNQRITQRVVKHVLELKNNAEENGIAFDPKKITLVGSSRGAYAVFQAAKELAKQNIKVNAVVQITPLTNGANYLLNTLRGNNSITDNYKNETQMTKDTHTLIDQSSPKSTTKKKQRISTKIARHSAAAVASPLVHLCTMNIGSATPAFQIKPDEKQQLTEAKIPVFQFIAHTDKGTTKAGHIKNSKNADYVIHGRDATHTELPTNKIIRDIVFNTFDSRVGQVNIVSTGDTQSAQKKTEQLLTFTPQGPQHIASNEDIPTGTVILHSDPYSENAFFPDKAQFNDLLSTLQESTTALRNKIKTEKNNLFKIKWESLSDEQKPEDITLIKKEVINSFISKENTSLKLQAKKLQKDARALIDTFKNFKIKIMPDSDERKKTDKKINLVEKEAVRNIENLFPKKIKPKQKKESKIKPKQKKESKISQYNSRIRGTEQLTNMYSSIKNEKLPVIIE